MRLAPGPIPDLAPDLSSLQGEPPEFSRLAEAELSDLPTIEAELDGFLGLLDGFDLPPELDVIDLQLSTVDQSLAELSAFTTDVHIQSAQDAVDLSTSQFSLVAAEAPAEIWSPVPAQMDAPAGTGPQPGVNGPTSIELVNLTAPGDATFYSGDQFEVDIQINSGGGNFDFANKPLMLTRLLNGSDIGALDIGSTDAFGRLAYKSSWNDSSVGARELGVDPPGFGTTPTVSFNVLAGPRPAGGGATSGALLQVKLENLTTGDPSTLHVANIWRILVNGPAGQPVYLRQIKDGADQGEVFVGSTDASGALLIAGTITAAQIGSYIETFRVGNAAVPNELVFTVLA